MYQLNEQWVEDYGTVKHMVKAVEQEQPECCESSCDFCCFEHFHCNRARIADCKFGKNYIVRDLGPVNEDGCLPCPFCGEFTTLKYELDENDESIYAVEHECSVYITTGWNHDKQAVINTWNGR